MNKSGRGWQSILPPVPLKVEIWAGHTRLPFVEPFSYHLSYTVQVQLTFPGDLGWCGEQALDWCGEQALDDSVIMVIVLLWCCGHLATELLKSLL